MPDPRTAEQPLNNEKGSSKKWYKATVILAHNGSGSMDEGTILSLQGIRLTLLTNCNITRVA